MLRHAVLVADLAAIFAVEDHYFDVALVAELPYSTIDSAYATFQCWANSFLVRRTLPFSMHWETMKPSKRSCAGVSTGFFCVSVIWFSTFLDNFQSNLHSFNSS